MGEKRSNNEIAQIEIANDLEDMDDVDLVW